MGRKKSSGDRRHIVANASGTAFCDNTVTNSKYTKWTFLPLNLFEQFHRPINFYFLVVAMLQFIPAIAPVSPFSTLGPLALAFSLTAAKEGYDDLQRHRQDDKDNARVYTRLNPATGALEDVPSRDIRVGNIIFLEQGEELPCDVVALLSENCVEGISYVSTENLDGETDSKQKLNALHSQLRTLEETISMDDAVRFVAQSALELHCDEANAFLRRFNGRLEFRKRAAAAAGAEPVSISCDINNLLLASSIVRTSTFVLGLVVYTGNETKVGMTKKFPPIKWARVDRRITRYCIGVFVLQWILTLIYGALGGTKLESIRHTYWYLGYQFDGVTTVLYTLVIPTRFFLMLTLMVPISFKVLVDLSKYYISRVIAWDVDMYDDVTKMPAVVNNTSIAEDLGQIQFVMSDKTGTLTENKMEFRYVRAEGVTYGDETSLDQLCADCGDKPALRLLALNLATNNVVQRHPECPTHSTSKTFFDAHLMWTSPSPDEVALVEGASRCRFRLVDRTRTKARVLVADRDEEAYEILHVLPFSSERGRSSILLTRIDGAAAAAGSGDDSASERDGRRTAPTTTTALLLTKGADERLIPLCASDPNFDKRATVEDLRLFSVRGLRTLVYAYKELSAEATAEFLEAYAKASTTEGESQRAEAVSTVYAALERDLTFLGISAVEDRLQQDVAETINKLRMAGVRVWMLTGDKRETARQIGISTGLTNPRDLVFELSADSAADAAEQRHVLREQLTRITTTCGGGPGGDGDVSHQSFGASPLSGTKEGLQVRESDVFNDIRSEYFYSGKLADEFAHGVFASHARFDTRSSKTSSSLGLIRERGRSINSHGAGGDDTSAALLGAHKSYHRGGGSSSNGKGAAPSSSSTSGGGDATYCITISGTSLEVIQQDDELLEEFRPVLLGAATVICCRVTPSQKALIVRMVKDSGAMTLAIGDGGNDVAMIQEAHVGVGITGREGHQAARAADFSFGQFRFLAPLMMCHGHSAFQRTAFILQYSFYKSVMIAWAQLLFNIDTQFSGLTYWNSFSLTMWNGAYTVPLTLLYVLDVHLSSKTLLANPRLYSLSQRSRYINATSFSWYIVRAILQSSIAYYCTSWLFGGSHLIGPGKTLDYQSQFIPTYTGVLLLQYLTVLTESHSFTWLHWLSFAVSWLGFVGSFAVYSLLKPFDFYGTYVFCMETPLYWIGSVLIAIIPYIWHGTFAAAKFWFFPSRLQLQRGFLMQQARRNDEPRTSVLQSMVPTC